MIRSGREISPPGADVLSGRVAIVTGASSGIGLATACALADAGARVHAVARRGQQMIEGAGQERVASGSVAPHPLDVSDRDAVEGLVQEVASQGAIDILVLAAGTNVPERRLEQLTPEVWDEMIAVNLSGAFYFVRAALPSLRESRGDVVFISSVSGSWPDLSGPAYQASKAGMVGLARAAGLEEHERGIRFFNILPGVVDTPLLDKRPRPPDEAQRAHMIQPEDVATACLFLLTLPRRVYIPELIILPTALQALGQTAAASLPARTEGDDTSR